MHARHLAQGYSVQIRGKRYYGVAYKEPRLQNRGELLERSYEDALARWSKTSGTEQGFFFIEDTSVAVEALSSSEEFPGPDVKYWMRETNFQSLDKMLKQRGNNRRAIVRSDVLLHLPRKFREANNLHQRYLIFTGMSHGKVTEREIPIQTNLLYPWLDNLSFNRWFVPEGCDVPLSALPIQNADEHDFRAVSVGAMLEFLAKHQVFEDRTIEKSWPTTLFLPGLLPPLLVVTGLPCAGKTTLGDHLSQKGGYYHIEASDFMKLAFYERHGLRSPLSIHTFAEEVLREKPGVVVTPVLEEIERRKAELVVITGLRAPEELEILLDNYRGPAKVQTWFIDAPQRLRFERSSRRARKDAAESFSAFKARDRMQNRMGLGRIRQAASRRVISNGETKAAYLKRCRGIFDVTVSVVQWPNASELHERPTSLEETILLGLARLSTRRETFSTTELAHRLNKIFAGSGMETSKNNVSRYFNFRFHPYYNVDLIDETIHYSLTATGRSRALRIMASLNESPSRGHGEADVASSYPLGKTHRRNSKMMMQLLLF